MSDLIGKVFGNLTVISREDDTAYLDGRREEMYRCRCGCKDKNEIVVSRYYLEKGYITHCGCKMAGTIIDLTGSRFGSLVVIERADDYEDTNGKKQVQWKCKCDCGNEVIVRGSNLRSGHTKSCGCSHSKINVTHGDSKTRLYKKWLRLKGMYDICDDWKDYTSFKQWAIANGYNEFGEDLQVYVKNKDLPLAPENCEMITNKEMRNKSDFNVNLTYDGKTMSLTKWAEYVGIPVSTLEKRLSSGWDVERILTTPVNSDVKTVFYNGRNYTMAELSSMCGIPRDTLYDRIIRGNWDVDKAMNTPISTAKYNIEHNGDTFNSNQWDHLLGYPRCTISSRINAGYTFAEALAGKPKARRKLPKNAIYFVEDGIGYSQEDWLKKEENDEKKEK